LDKHPLGIWGNQALYHAKDFQYTWEKDSEGRRIPFLVYMGSKYRINTLHIFHKNLKPFLSK